MQDGHFGERMNHDCQNFKVDITKYYSTTRAEIKNGRFCLLGLKAPRGT